MLSCRQPLNLTETHTTSFGSPERRFESSYLFPFAKTGGLKSNEFKTVLRIIGTDRIYRYKMIIMMLYEQLTAPVAIE